MITEDQLEQLAIQWFQDTGWNHVHGAVIAPERVSAEREDFLAVVLKGRLAEAVRRLNPKLPVSAVEEVRRHVAMPGQVVHVVTKPEHPSLVQSKERRYPIALTMRGPWGSGLPRFMVFPWTSADGSRRSLSGMPHWGGRMRMRF